jgi:hypothetical protein
MRAAVYTAALLVALVFAGRTASAGEVTLKGKMVCGKCTLNETKECSNVLLVDEKGKQTKYYLTDNALAKKNHEAVCSGEAPATVKGTVKTSKGKKMLTATAINME